MHSRHYSPRLFRIISTVLLVILCLLLNELTQISHNKYQLPKDEPEYSALGVSGSLYNSITGKLLYFVQGDKLWKYPSNNKIYMKKFVAKMYDDKSTEVKYLVTGDDGWVDPNQQIGMVGANAHLQVFDKDPTQDVNIYGKDVYVDMNKHLIYSSQDVKAINKNNTVSGHGFTYDYVTKFLNLGTTKLGNSKSRVNVQYQ
jgi:LPS export ABC transporter protein LptC